MIQRIVLNIINASKLITPKFKIYTRFTIDNNNSLTKISMHD